MERLGMIVRQRFSDCLLMAISIVLVSSTLNAQQLVRYAISGANSFSSSTVAPTGIATNINASALSATGLDPLLVYIGFNGHFLFKNWQEGAAPVANDKYFSFTISPNPGLQIDFSTITYTLASRVPNATWELRSSVDNYTSNFGVHTTQPGPDADQHPFTDSVSSLGSQTGPVTFRIYGYNEVSTNYSGLVNNVRIFGGEPGQDVLVNGTVMEAPVVAPLNPPVILDQPHDQTVIAGEDAIFTALATGNSSMFYQWFRNGIALSSASADTLILTNVVAADAGTYTVEVRNSGGVTLSAPATLTVLLAPTIVQQPESRLAKVGTEVVFSVAAKGAPPLDYQWLRNGERILGATSAIFSLRDVQESDSGVYSVQVRNEEDSILSQPAELSVVAPPYITAQPSSQTAVLGASVNFIVTASGSAPFRYQWRKNGSDINGANGSSLELTNLEDADAGTYSVEVSNAADSILSQGALLNLTPPPQSPPTLSAFADLTMLENSFVIGIAFTIDDKETPVSFLTLSVDSSNQDLIPLSNIFLGGSGNDRLLGLIPVPDRSGTARISIGVSDGSASTTRSFLVTVRVNDAQIGIKRLSARGVQLTLNCPPNHPYVIESSSDLIKWFQLSILVGATGSIEFTDLDVQSTQQRFYRARQAD
jgi:hypothetical protein